MEKSDKTKMIFLILLILFCSCTESTKSDVDIAEDNLFMQDSILQIYLPNSLLDSSYRGEADFDQYNIMYFASDKLTSMKIVYPIDTFSEKGIDFICRKLALRDIYDLNRGNIKGTYISMDTFDKKYVIRYMEGCNEDAVLVTRCYVLSPLKNRIYRIFIRSANTLFGNSFKDSIPKIINSISFRDGFKH